MPASRGPKKYHGITYGELPPPPLVTENRMAPIHKYGDLKVFGWPGDPPEESEGDRIARLAALPDKEMGEGLFEVERITEWTKTPGKPTKPVRDHKTKNIFPPTWPAPPLPQEAGDPLDRNRPKSIDAFKTAPMTALPYPISNAHNASGSSSSTDQQPTNRHSRERHQERQSSSPGNSGKKGLGAAGKQDGKQPVRGDHAPAVPDKSRGSSRS